MNLALVVVTLSCLAHLAVLAPRSRAVDSIWLLLLLPHCLPCFSPVPHLVTVLPTVLLYSHLSASSQWSPSLCVRVVCT